MAKKPDGTGITQSAGQEHTAPAGPMVKVKLKCTYSGYPGDPGPGTVVEVDVDEAARLVEVGGADLLPAE